MSGEANLNQPIVEALYREALILADDVRAAFDLSARSTGTGEHEDLTRIAMSCEALRTTTRMMHIIAWLLNQRAFFNGEISELALRRHGRLPKKTARSDPEHLARIEPEIRELVLESERLYARVERLDQAWQESFELGQAEIHRMHKRISEQVSRF
ncbi:MAG TPA: DUF1465 family protein [Sphingomonadaceae bacterium]|nr:DUF1465 family protein [Sphingomonadaceae bacterium]